MIYRYNNIGACCREFRKDKNITVNVMAKRSGCSPQMITAFERSENMSGRILLEYVKNGLVIMGVNDDDFYICRNRREGELVGY